MCCGSRSSQPFVHAKLKVGQGRWGAEYRWWWWWRWGRGSGRGRWAGDGRTRRGRVWREGEEG